MAFSKKKVLLVFFIFVVLIGAGFAAGFYYKKAATPQRANVDGLDKVFNACANLNQSYFNLKGDNASDSLSFYSSLVDACNAVKNPEGVDFSLFWQAWNQIKEQYVDRTNLDSQKMVYGAIGGMVSSLGDPYTVFFNPKDAQMFKEDVTGSFDGVGMEIGLKNNQLQVISPLQGTPAQKAGLRAGDQILEIDGTSTVGMTTDQAATLIRGTKGTQVTLTIMRDGWSASQKVTLTRDTIQIPSLKLEYKTLPDGSQAAYITLYEFSENAYSDFNNAALQILNSPAKKIILDLRDNPGGYLEVAQGIAGWLLPKGDQVVTEDFGNGETSINYTAQGPSSLSGYPIVVLVNGGSASAAEILAGALRDDRNVQLIGTQTFGKGSVQELFGMPDGSSLKITVAKWLTPKGNMINGVGLTPDVKVDMTDQDIQQGKDPQLDKAIEILGGM